MSAAPTFYREDTFDAWHVRVSHEAKPDKNGHVKVIIICELVWGRAFSKDGKDGVNGEAYHTLTGPTAEKSMRTFCDHLNASKTLPAKLQLCAADGAKLPADGGEQQMMFGETAEKKGRI